MNFEVRLVLGICQSNLLYYTRASLCSWNVIRFGPYLQVLLDCFESVDAMEFGVFRLPQRFWLGDQNVGCLFFCGTLTNILTFFVHILCSCNFCWFLWHTFDVPSLPTKNRILLFDDT